jgi:hypothetical protein
MSHAHADPVKNIKNAADHNINKHTKIMDF